MSAPVNRHVPVGTGQQIPNGYYQAPRQQAVVVTTAPSGQPARQVPSSVRQTVEYRTHYHQPSPSVVVVQAQHRADRDRDVRQIPGSNAVVGTFRNVHK